MHTNDVRFEVHSLIQECFNMLEKTKQITAIQSQRLYTVKEVMQLFHLSLTTVRSYCHSGDLVSYKLGKGINAPIRILGQSLIDFLQ